MALFRVQVSLPDRPGSLGAVASAIGFAGGDIRGLLYYEVKMAVALMTSQLQFQAVIQQI
jgi:hypothetical protein